MIPLPPLTDKSPLTVNVPRLIAVVPLSMVTLPVVPAVIAEMAPVNALVVSLKVILVFVPVLVKLEVPPTVKAPDWLIAAPEETVNVPLTESAARSNVVVSKTETFTKVPPELKATVLAKLLEALATVIL